MSALSLKQARMKPIYLFSATSAVLLQLAWCPIPFPLTCSSLYFRLRLFVHNLTSQPTYTFYSFSKTQYILQKIPHAILTRHLLTNQSNAWKIALFPTSFRGTNSLSVKFLWLSKKILSSFLENLIWLLVFLSWILHKPLNQPVVILTLILSID